MKNIILASCFGFALATTLYFFVPPASDAEARTGKWANASYANCVIENLKDMQSDRAVNLLDEYCLSTR